MSQVNTDSETFWASMGDAFSPYDCYPPIFAAAKELDGPTLAGLLAGDPPGKTQFKEAIDQWVEQNPGKLLTSGHRGGRLWPYRLSARCDAAAAGGKERHGLPGQALRDHRRGLFLFLFERGDYYKGTAGKDTGTQQVNTLTSVDLYDAATGTFLRHLGNLRESAPNTVYASYGDTSLQYPVPTESDVLLHLYHNINGPDAYLSLVDNSPVNGSIMEPGQPVQFAGWEITYRSARIVSEFEYGMYVFSADEGKQCVLADLTVTNRGLDSDTFLPVVYYPNEDPTLYVTDPGKENRYDCVDVMLYSPCLNEPGNSKEGELVFQIPDSLAQSGDPLYIAATMGSQVVYYPLG